MYSAPAPLVLERRAAIPGNDFKLRKSKLSQVALAEKNLSVNVGHKRLTQEIQIRSQGREDPLEEGMITHSSILAWRIPWTEEPGRIQSMGLQRVGHD